MKRLRDHPAVLLPVLSPSSTRITRERAVKCHSGPPATPRETPAPDDEKDVAPTVQPPELGVVRTLSSGEMENLSGGMSMAGAAAGRASSPRPSPSPKPGIRHEGPFVLAPNGAERASWARKPSKSGTEGVAESMSAIPSRGGLTTEEIPVHPVAGLTPAELAAFEKDGFVVLRGLIPPEECRRFLWDAVVPALSRAGVDYKDEETWGGKSGDVIMAPDGGDHPIPKAHPDSRWPALFQSGRLKQALDELHGGKHRWRWANGAASGLGWIHLRYPVVEPSEPWDYTDRRWHIDGNTGRCDTHQSVVVLPMVTPIYAGGGGTVLLRGSHHTVARWLHDQGEWGVGNHRRINSIVQQAMEAEGMGVAVEAVGNAGDVLLMHPLLVHATNDARRVTFHLCRDLGPGELGSSQPRWTAMRHGIRVTFNLSTNWTSMPLVEPHREPSDEPRSLLEHSIIHPIATGMHREETKEKLLLYSEVLEVRFTNCGMMLAAELDYEGLCFASQPRVPARREHDLRFHSPSRPKGGAGLPICYGDVLVIKCRGHGGRWHRLGVTPTRDLSSRARALCGKGETHVTTVQWGAKGTTEQQLFRVEGFCDLRGVALRAGDKFYLRAVHCSREGQPNGCHLQADWDQGITDGWRHVACQTFERGNFQEVEAFKVGPMRQLEEIDLLPRAAAELMR